MKKYLVLLMYLIAPLVLFVWLLNGSNSDNPDDLYIEILKFGKANLGNPISYEQLESYLNEIGLEYNEFAAMYLFAGAYVDENNPGGNQFQVPRDSKSFYLHIGGYSELLNYSELKEARESSRRAILIAALAIVVSILIPLISRLFQKKENPDIIRRNENQTGNLNLDRSNGKAIGESAQEKLHELSNARDNTRNKGKRER